VVVFIHTSIGGGDDMGNAVKKTISLPSKLAKEVEALAREEGKPLSAVIQDAIRLARKERIKKDFYQIQDYWSRKAKEKGILTVKDLERYLKT
jgi:metal-responsive CopG/Arc/MetJ family transcriptional regulator